MALFKPFRGTRATLETQEMHDGYAYFCTDDGSFHIDCVDSDGNLQRKQINAKDAETLMGMSLDEIKEHVAVQSDFNQTDETKADFIKNKPDIPTKTSELTNDSNFVTLSDVPDEIYVGNGDMPEDATIQILTDGSDAEAELKDDLKEYIDSKLANDSNIDVTAEVGQTIVVKAVDENGKPTAWESADYQPKTHWTEEVEILPETTVEIDPEEGVGVLPAIVLVGGDEYTVTYNGVEYISECDSMTAEGVEFLFVGNLPLAMETGDNGQPFVIGDDGEGGSMIMALDGSTSVTLSITHRKVTTIPVQYIPKQKTCAEITVSLDEFEYISASSSYTLRKSYDVSEIVDALYNALPIYLNVISNGAFSRMQCIFVSILGDPGTDGTIKQALDTWTSYLGKGNIPLGLRAYEPSAHSRNYFLDLNYSD